MKRAPYLIGLTGNIATGKTAVAQMLAELGALVIDADQVAHEAMQPDGPAYDSVVDAFGPAILTAEGTVDRAKLGPRVFRDPEALARLEAAVHPAVVEEVDRRIKLATKPVVVVEAIKLIEAGMHRHYDALWVVTARRQAQIARIVATRGLSEKEAALRVDAQPPQAEKVAVADLILTNNGSLAELRQKVAAAWRQLHARLEQDLGACAEGSMERYISDQQSPSGDQPQPDRREDVTIRPVRRDSLADAAGVANVLNSVINEGGRTVLTGHWTPEAELAFLQTLGGRSELLIAESEGCIVGFQVIEPFVTYTSTMDHVAHIGTYVLAGHRRRGIGRQLAAATLAYAESKGYEKCVVYVLARNKAGLAYYRQLGFKLIGTLERQTRIDSVYYDEVVMELHFFDDRRVPLETSRI